MVNGCKTFTFVSIFKYPACHWLGSSGGLAVKSDLEAAVVPSEAAQPEVEDVLDGSDVRLVASLMDG